MSLLSQSVSRSLEKSIADLERMRTMNGTLPAARSATVFAEGSDFDSHSHSHGSADGSDHGHSHGSGSGSGDHGHSHGSGGGSGDHGHSHGAGTDHGHSHGFCSDAESTWSAGLHIAAIFIVLACSLLGVLVPIVGRYCRKLTLSAYTFVLGKCLASGVLLSVALVHMLNHSTAAFEAECIPASFTTKFHGWSFLLATVSAVVMHIIDLLIAEFTTLYVSGMATRAHPDENALEASSDVASDDRQDMDDAVRIKDNAQAARASGTAEPCCDEHYGHHHGGYVSSADDTTERSPVQRVVAAVCMEFGVTLHSVLVGVTVGVTGNDDLKPLLVALAFHQFFEGVAVGARLVDASFHASIEMVMLVVFSFSAPIGIAAATGAISNNRSALASSTYAMVCGIFDAICGGIMLYLAFGMLLVDFPMDVRRVCARGSKYRALRIFGMVLCLAIGTTCMTVIGKWL